MTNMLWAANSVVEQRLVIRNTVNNRTFHSKDRLMNVKAVKILGTHPISDTIIRELQLLQRYSYYIGLTEAEKKLIVQEYRLIPNLRPVWS